MDDYHFFATGGEFARAGAIDACAKDRKGVYLNPDIAISVLCLDAPEFIPVNRTPTWPELGVSVRRGSPLFD